MKRKHYVVTDLTNGISLSTYITKAYDKTDAFDNWRGVYGIEHTAQNFHETPDGVLVKFMSVKETSPKNYGVLKKYVEEI